MGAWRDFPLPDGSYSDATRPWSQQDVVNYLPTFAEQSGARSNIKYTPVPGLQSFARVGTGPHRGGRDVEGKCFIVSGNKLYQLLPSGISTELGTIPGTGLVSMTHNQIANGNELVIGTGSNSYVYNTVESTLTATGVPLFSVDFINQLIVGVDQARRFWRYSGLADATSWNTLDNESAESSPDRIVGGIVSQGEWLVFGERTIEPWPNDPAQDTAFIRASGRIAERGCINANTIKRLDNTVFFVDNNFIPCRLQGSQPVPIAPKAIIDEISRCDPTKLLAYTWEDRGYVVYYVTAQDGQTWGYDVTSQKWHRRESFGLDRWRLNTLFKWNGDWYGGDYTNGNLYKLTWGYPYESCELMPRRIRSGVLHNNGNRVFVHGLKLNLQAGAPEVASPTVPTFSGDLGDDYTGESVDYQYAVSGTGTITLTAGALPDGLAMNAGGRITGTRTTIGEYSWTVEFTDGCGNTITIEDFSNTWGRSVVDPEVDAVKYLVVEPGDVTDYSSPSFDDSAWDTGLAPFGNIDNALAASVGFQLSPATNWPLGKKLWYRSRLYLNSTAGVTMDIYTDDAGTVWVNGTQVYTHDSMGGSGIGYFYTPGQAISAVNLVVGWNDIAVMSQEIYGGNSFFDYRIEQTGYTAPTPASAASVITVTTADPLTGGHFVEVRYSNDGGENYSNWRLLDIGTTGSFLKELILRRLGFCRDRVWEFRDTSAVIADVLAASVIMESE